MKFSAQLVLALSVALLATACSKSESRTCVYNNREISCEDFDRISKGGGTQPTTRAPSAPPAVSPAPKATPQPVPTPKPAPLVTDSTASHINCLVATDKARLSNEEETAVCAHANVYSSGCVNSAYEVGLTSSEIVEVCTNARSESSTCLEDSLALAMFHSDIAKLCR